MPCAVVVTLLAFACGVVTLQTRAELPPGPAFMLAGALGIAIVTQVAHRYRRVGGLVAAMITCICAFATGFGYAAWRAELRLADALASAWEGENLRVVGIVDSLPVVTPQGRRFVLAVETVLTEGATVPARIGLAWMKPRHRGDEPPLKEIPLLHPGERWELTVRLKRPQGNVNPGGFDLEAWLLQQNLRATGYVHDEGENVLRSAHAGRWRDHVQRMREGIRERVERALPGAAYAGVVTALAIGDQSAITERQWSVFNRTGVGHLVSISGLHVTVFASLLGGFALLCLRRIVALTSIMPARKVSTLVGVLAAGGYVLLAGAEIPAVRTFAMLAIAACGLWWGRPGSAGTIWLWALAGVLLFDPFASLTPGFWLSYGAVGLLLYGTAARLPGPPARTWRAWGATILAQSAHAQWIVTLGLAPLTLAWFGQMSLIGPVANAVAIPVVTLAVVPLALLGIALPFDMPFQASHAVLAPLMALLERLAAGPVAAWQQHAPPSWAIAAALAGVVWLLAPRGVPGRAWGVVWLVPLFVVLPPRPAQGAFHLALLDVGQGLAAVVTTREHVLVYDTGPRFTDTADAGGRIVAPYLRHQGLPRADALIVSHQDLDHSGGALSLLQTVPVGWLASSLPADHAIAAQVGRTAPVSQCVAGQHWTWDDVHFTVLHPTATEYGDSHARTNDRSCVIRIDSVHGSALLTGDIEAKSEAALVRLQAAALRVDVALVPHHGSRTSSIPAFVRAMSPRIALVANGYRNRFGHPRADVVARYQTIGARVMRTDELGAIAIAFSADAPLAVTWARAQRARYWLARPQAIAREGALTLGSAVR